MGSHLRSVDEARDFDALKLRHHQEHRCDEEEGDPGKEANPGLLVALAVSRAGARTLVMDGGGELAVRRGGPERRGNLSRERRACLGRELRGRRRERRGRHNRQESNQSMGTHCDDEPAYSHIITPGLWLWLTEFWTNCASPCSHSETTQGTTDDRELSQLRLSIHYIVIPNERHFGCVIQFVTQFSGS